MSEESRQGGCRCGRVRFQAHGRPLLTLACHCTGCQRITASAFALTETYPAAAFRITEGEVVVGGLRGPTRHNFCDYCKSWVYTEPEGMEELVNIRSPMFDDPDKQAPFVEIFKGEALPWVRTGATHSYETLPAMDEWPKLVEEYAARGSAAMEDASQ